MSNIHPEILCHTCVTSHRCLRKSLHLRLRRDTDLACVGRERVCVGQRAHEGIQHWTSKWTAARVLNVHADAQVALLRGGKGKERRADAVARRWILKRIL